MSKLGFIGAGTVGTALAIRLSKRGYKVVSVSSPNNTSAKKLAQALDGCCAFSSNQAVADTAELVFITTPDDVIATVVSTVNWHPGQSVVHCCGSDSVNSLEPPRKQGASVGVIHPLQTFASVVQAINNIAGSTFALEGEEPLLSTLKEIATALDGTWIELSADDKVLYHAAAVISCNYLVALVKMATDIWQIFDVSPERATQALLPLLRGTVANIEKVGIPKCLTGPIARGDTGTIVKHIKAMQKAAPALLLTYIDLGLQTIPIAMDKGRINQYQAEEMKMLLQDSREYIEINKKS